MSQDRYIEAEKGSQSEPGNSLREGGFFPLNRENWMI
ncbi:Uncharacterised protein [Brucella intermedia]|nr:Uncharacterised protein [Brucella intermedia]